MPRGLRAWLTGTAKRIARPPAKRASKRTDAAKRWDWILDMHVGDVVIVREANRVTVVGRHWVN